MRCIDLITAFELEINKLDDSLNKPVTDDTLYWINQGVMKFVKDRFNGNAPKRTSYEQNEKRTRDLVHLLCERTIHLDKKIVEEVDIYFPNRQDFILLDDDALAEWKEVYENEPTNNQYIDIEDVYKVQNIKDALAFVAEDTNHPSYDAYEFLYPKNMMFALNEDVIISDTKDKNKMDVCVFECTADNFMYRVNNKLTDFHYRFNRARPLRIRTKRGFKLLTDKKYKINTYTLGYLRIPNEVTNENPYREYTDFEDYTWQEIVKIAAQMYIENQSDPRYKTITAEVLTQE